MKKGGIGGGNTQTGLRFEGKVDLLTFLSTCDGYAVEGNVIYFQGKEVARSFRKHALYRWLNEQGIDWRQHLSKQLLPDDAIYVIRNNTMFIIEVKYQEVEGSVDEKLQTCDFKRKQYLKLLSPLNMEVEYIYVLNDWFRQPKYKDVLDYIISVNCKYYFNYLPLEKIGLPLPSTPHAEQ